MKNENQQKFFGQKIRKRRRGSLTEYGRMLREKQELKEIYGLRERQFKKYIREVLNRRGKEDIANLLAQRLERRLDNVVFRLGFALTRSQARQFVSHGHFLVNSRKVTVPSYQLELEDEITIRPGSANKAIFKGLLERLKKHQVPAWLDLDKEKLKARVIGQPTLNQANLAVQIPLIFEFYSR